MALTEFDLNIVNDALSALGEPPITSFDDGSPAANMAKARYATIRDKMLSEQLWTFSRTRTPLALNRELEGQVPWRYYYNRPDNMATVGPATVVNSNDRTGESDVEFDVLDGFIVSNSKNVDAIYSGLVDASKFSAGFRHCLALKVAESFGSALTADDDRVREIRMQLWGNGRTDTGEWGRLLLSDSASRPPATFRSDRVLQSRYGWSGFGYGGF